MSAYCTPLTAGVDHRLSRAAQSGDHIFQLGHLHTQTHAKCTRSEHGHVCKWAQHGAEGAGKLCRCTRRLGGHACKWARVREVRVGTHARLLAQAANPLQGCAHVQHKLPHRLLRSYVHTTHLHMRAHRHSYSPVHTLAHTLKRIHTHTHAHTPWEEGASGRCRL